MQRIFAHYILRHRYNLTCIIRADSYVLPEYSVPDINSMYQSRRRLEVRSNLRPLFDISSIISFNQSVITIFSSCRLNPRQAIPVSLHAATMHRQLQGLYNSAYANDLRPHWQKPSKPVQNHLTNPSSQVLPPGKITTSLHPYIQHGHGVSNAKLRQPRPPPL